MPPRLRVWGGGRRLVVHAEPVGWFKGRSKPALRPSKLHAPPVTQAGPRRGAWPGLAWPAPACRGLARPADLLRLEVCVEGAEERDGGRGVQRLHREAVGAPPPHQLWPLLRVGRVAVHQVGRRVDQVRHAPARQWHGREEERGQQEPRGVGARQLCMEGGCLVKATICDAQAQPKACSMCTPSPLTHPRTPTQPTCVSTRAAPSRACMPLRRSQRPTR